MALWRGNVRLTLGDKQHYCPLVQHGYHHVCQGHIWPTPTTCFKQANKRKVVPLHLGLEQEQQNGFKEQDSRIDSRSWATSGSDHSQDGPEHAEYLFWSFIWCPQESASQVTMRSFDDPYNDGWLVSLPANFPNVDDA